MRRRLVISTIAIVLVVLGALAVPVGLIVYNAAERQLNQQLQVRAQQVADEVGADLAEGAEPDLGGVYDILGPNDSVRIEVAGEDGPLINSIPVDGSLRSARAEGAEGIRVQLATDASPLDDDFRAQLRILLLLALGAVAAAAGLAAVQSFQLARPLERLASRAGRIGDGDFSFQPFARTHIPEIDHIGTALDNSAQRVDTLLANERHFTADATHQLRTGIAGIAMRLEILSMSNDPSVSEEATVGLKQTDQLNATIDELLAAARNRTTNERTLFDLSKFVNDHVREWRPRFSAVRRHISVITANPPPPVFATKGLAGQVIDILIDNALRHGAGAVTLMIDGPAVVVIDQGPGVPQSKLKTMFDGPVDPAARHGRGLPLARRLAQVDGATLDVVGNRPLRFRFEMVKGNQAPMRPGPTPPLTDDD